VWELGPTIEAAMGGRHYRVTARRAVAVSTEVGPSYSSVQQLRVRIVNGDQTFICEHRDDIPAEIAENEQDCLQQALTVLSLERPDP
jgi:hypothetical protein